MADQRKCCEEILKRLTSTSWIRSPSMLQKMAGENEQLRKDLDDLQKAHDALDQYVKGLPKPLTAAETSQIVDTRTAEQIERARMPRFSIVGLNAGADQSGNITFTGRGRYFMPFKEQFAVQLQGEYMYFRDRQEGQFDFGLVNRFATRAQAGFFGSLKHVNFSGHSPGPTSSPTVRRMVQSGNQQFTTDQITGGGLIGQGSVVLDYLFTRGGFGIFGSKGFLNDAVLNRVGDCSRTSSRGLSAHGRPGRRKHHARYRGQLLSRRQLRLPQEPRERRSAGRHAALRVPAV